MRQFAASITIHAPPETIWALLTDAAGYKQWNSTVARIDGRIEAGGKVTVRGHDGAGQGVFAADH